MYIVVLYEWTNVGQSVIQGYYGSKRNCFSNEQRD